MGRYRLVYPFLSDVEGGGLRILVRLVLLVLLFRNWPSFENLVLTSWQLSLGCAKTRFSFVADHVLATLTAFVFGSL